MLDIIIVLVVGALVISRFFIFKLPTDTRDKQARKADFEKLFGRPVLMRDDEEMPKDITAQSHAVIEPAQKKKKDVSGLEGIALIQAKDESFSEERFLAGAQAAYTYFYSCWNAKDEEGMDHLCGPKLLNRIVGRWQVSDGPGAYETVTVDDVTDVRIVHARVNGRTAIVDVAFTAVHRQGGGVPKTVRSTWILARAMGSDDPNWELQDMTTGVDA